jgi:hypothetical protein
VRPSHFLADAERVYVTHADGVTALDATLGASALGLWTSIAQPAMCLTMAMAPAKSAPIANMRRKSTNPDFWMM